MPVGGLELTYFTPPTLQSCVEQRSCKMHLRGNVPPVLSGADLSSLSALPLSFSHVCLGVSELTLPAPFQK